MEINEPAIRQTVNDVIAAMFAIPESERAFPWDWWPGSNCEQTSVAIAAVLEDRNLGRWSYVNAGRSDGELGGHAWLELEDPDTGEAVYTIDATLHQFPQWSNTPYVGRDRTPAAAHFDKVHYAGSYRDWKFIGTDRDVFLTNVRQVREVLEGRDPKTIVRYP